MDKTWTQIYGYDVRGDTECTYSSSSLSETTIASLDEVGRCEKICSEDETCGGFNTYSQSSCSYFGLEEVSPDSGMALGTNCYVRGSKYFIFERFFILAQRKDIRILWL